MNEVTKSCSKCGLEKPATTVFYNTEKRGRLGLRAYCKQCQKQMFAAWYSKNREKQIKKALDKYHANPEKSKAANTAWRKSNPEKSKARNRTSWWRHREKRIRETVQWQRTNKYAKLAISHAYRAKARSAEGRFTKAEFQNKIKKQDECCFYCGVKMAAPVVEHVVPLSRGGSNLITNIVAACVSCNCSKGGKTLEEFRPDLAMHFQATR